MKNYSDHLEVSTDVVSVGVDDLALIYADAARLLVKAAGAARRKMDDNCLYYHWELLTAKMIRMEQPSMFWHVTNRNIVSALAQGFRDEAFDPITDSYEESVLDSFEKADRLMEHGGIHCLNCGTPTVANSNECYFCLRNPRVREVAE